jgi:glyoxylase-like metal-dependent hydrolase (beta-lactamase superfamily II)
MPLTRRHALALGYLALAAGPAALARGRDDPERFFEWKPLADGVWLAAGLGCNSLLVAGRELALLVDVKKAPAGERLRREAWELTRLPIDAVNTHHHPVQTGGNHAFVNDRRILAHAAATPRILAQLNRYVAQSKDIVAALESLPENEATSTLRREARDYYFRVHQFRPMDFCPTQTFDQRLELDLGGVTVELVHTGAGHTDNDIAVRLPERGVVHAGDLVWPGHHPLPDPEGGGSLAGWRAGLGALRGLVRAGDLLVAGTGDPADAAAIDEQLAYFDRAEQAVGQAKAAGRSRREVVGMAVPGLGGPGSPANLPMVLGWIFDRA